VVPSVIDNKYDVDPSESLVSSSSNSSSLRSPLKTAGILAFIALVALTIACINQRQIQIKRMQIEGLQHRTRANVTTLMHDGSNSIYFTDMSSRTVDTDTNLSSKTDYNFDPIPSQISAMPSAISSSDPEIYYVKRDIGMGMASSDSTPIANRYSTGRSRVGGESNRFHQLQPVEII